jgi:hypothetical protein
MTRDDAVEKLRRAGFVAFKRDWAPGETVGAATTSYRRGEITCYPDMLYVCPASGGWRIDDSSTSRDQTTYATLEEAVFVAERSLRCKKLASPPSSE